MTNLIIEWFLSGLSFINLTLWLFGIIKVIEIFRGKPFEVITPQKNKNNNFDYTDQLVEQEISLQKLKLITPKNMKEDK